MVEVWQPNSLELINNPAVMPATSGNFLELNHDLGQRCAAVADRDSAADHHPAGAVLALTSIDDTGRVRSTVVPDAPAFPCPA